MRAKSHDPSIRAAREAIARRVVEEFGNELPNLRSLAFFDDQDYQEAIGEMGAANRGYSGPIKDKVHTSTWPARMACLIWVPVVDSSTRRWTRVFDHGIYLHGSTCADETALTMTFAHELQHFLQYGHKRRLWAEGRVITNLPRELLRREGLNSADIPHEREARIVAKRTTLVLRGSDTTKQYIERRISEAVGREDAEDADDWRFVQQLDPFVPFDLAVETDRIFQRLRPHREALEEALKELKEHRLYGSDFDAVNLCAYYGAP